MKKRTAEVLLAAVIAARSTGYIQSKLLLGTMGTFTLLAVRFLLAFAILSLLFHKKLKSLSRKTLLLGLTLGIVYFGMMTAELTGLKTTDSSTTSFIENLAILLVPLYQSVLEKRLPDRKTVLTGILALAGVGLLTLKSGSFVFTLGEVWCLAAAMLYALGIVLTGRFSQNNDPITLGILEVGFLGLFALCGALCFETLSLPQTLPQWGGLAGLVLVCTCFGYTLQPLAQSGTTAQRAGLFCAINPVVAAVLGRVFLQEKLGLWGTAGAVLVIGSIVLSKLLEATQTAAKPGSQSESAL